MKPQALQLEGGSPIDELAKLDNKDADTKASNDENVNSVSGQALFLSEYAKDLGSRTLTDIRIRRFFFRVLDDLRNRHEELTKNAKAQYQVAMSNYSRLDLISSLGMFRAVRTKLFGSDAPVSVSDMRLCLARIGKQLDLFKSKSRLNPECEPLRVDYELRNSLHYLNIINRQSNAGFIKTVLDSYSFLMLELKKDLAINERISNDDSHYLNVLINQCGQEIHDLGVDLDTTDMAYTINQLDEVLAESCNEYRGGFRLH